MLKLLPWIQKQRTEKKVRQEDIAEGLGLTQAQISRILNGETALRVDVYLQLAEIVGFDPVEGIRVCVSKRAA